MVKKINGAAGSDILLGTSADDLVSAGAGMDSIYGFVGLDTIDGGAGYDTLFISSTSLDLNTATDAQLVNLEEVSAQIANGGVRIDLTKQSEGITLTGSAFNDFLTGGHGADIINAGVGDDTIYWLDGEDTVNGGLGLDTIITTTNIITTSDAQLTSVEDISAATATTALVINLGSQSEKFLIVGSSYSDSITGGSGADVISSGSGDDAISGFIGNDFINAGAGVDTLNLTATSVYLNAAMDYQLIDLEAVTAAGARSSVVIDVSRQSEGFTITGSSFSDTLKGGQGADKFIGSSGADFIDGGFGEDILYVKGDLKNITNAQITNVESISAADAQSGVTINLGAQNEKFTLTGSAFADILTGGVGSDFISGGGGDDNFMGFAGADTIDGGAGFDLLALSVTSSSLNSATDIQIRNVEAITAASATAGVNINLSNQTEGFQITGSDTPDTIKGGSGDDTIFSFNGTDFIDGGRGFDTLKVLKSSNNLNGASDSQITNFEEVSALDASAGVTINLSNQNESLIIVGSNYSDILTGTAQSDTFVGFLGNDTINGSGGIDVITLTATSTDLNSATNLQITNIERVSATAAAGPVTINLSQQTEKLEIVGSAFSDTLIGGAGADKITGGAGADHFVFNTLPSDRTFDSLLDFVSGVDRLELNNSSFVALGQQGQLLNAQFWSSETATSAHDADDRIIYNSTTGALFYDADGVNGSSAIQIATLSSKPILAFSDIIII
jgi:hypothetical protein